MISRRHLLALGGFGALAAAAGCSRSGGDDPDKVTVGLTYIPNVQFCAFYLGLSQDLFSGIDVELRHHGEQEDLFGALMRSQEQLVFASSDEAIVANLGLTTLATSYQTYPAQILFRGDAAGLDDLRGRSLGIPGRFGSSYHAALVALQSAGLTEDDVELIEIGFTQVSAMATAEVDAIVGFTNNELVQLEMQGEPVTAVPISEEAMLVGPGLITSDEYKDSPAVAAVVEGMLEAERAVVADPQAALDATAEFVPAIAEQGQREMAERVLAATAELWLDPAGEVSVDVDEDAMARMETFLTQEGFVG